jgi:DNA-binding NarL/FixJ family response regulator
MPRQILKRDPAQRILVVTDVNSEQIVRDCLDAGVHGWVFKSDGIGDLRAAIEELQRHKSAFSPRVSDLVLDGYLAPLVPPRPR